MLFSIILLIAAVSSHAYNYNPIFERFPVLAHDTRQASGFRSYQVSHANQPNLLVRQGCNAGYKLCGQGCIASGDQCCSSAQSTSCPAGYYCDQGGCCENGQTCSGYSGQCPRTTKRCGSVCIDESQTCTTGGAPANCASLGQVACGSRCMPAGASCCPNGLQYCDPGLTCNADNTCGTVAERCGEIQEVQCGDRCMPSGASCCPNGLRYCNPGITCNADNTCGSIAQRCGEIGEVQCGDRCMPSGASCCPNGLRYCDPGIACNADNTCGSVSQRCAAIGEVQCSDTCMPQGHVCCPDGRNCPSGYTCGSGNLCEYQGSSLLASIDTNTFSFGAAPTTAGDPAAPSISMLGTSIFTPGSPTTVSTPTRSTQPIGGGGGGSASEATVEDRAGILMFLSFAVVVANAI